MAADTFRTVSSESWFSRLAGSIKSVLVGIVLFLVAFPLLIWNEGRAVQTAKSLREGASHVVSVLLPAPGGPVIPMRCARPMCRCIAASSTSLPARWFSTMLTARASAAFLPAPKSALSARRPDDADSGRASALTASPSGVHRVHR